MTDTEARGEREKSVCDIVIFAHWEAGETSVFICVLRFPKVSVTVSPRIFFLFFQSLYHVI